MALIETRLKNGVMKVQFNRAHKKNAITAAMYQALADAFCTARDCAEVAVVLISGQKCCFTAGNDLTDFFNDPPRDDSAPIFQFLRAVATCPKPLIAAVNGPIIGIGATLLLHCDLVVSGTSARFQLPFINLGLVPEFASSLLLPLRVGHAKAAEWLLTGKTFYAAEAQTAGLINEVHNDEQYFSAAWHQAETMAALPLASLLTAKQLLKQPYMQQTLQTLEHEAVLFRQFLAGEDFKKAVNDFFGRAAQ